MHVKPSRSIPDVLKRAFDAFRNNDPISMAEAFAVDARLTTEYDPKLAEAVGLQGIEGPILASSAVGILRFYAYELSMFDVKDMEIVSSAETNTGMQAVCRWSVRMQHTGQDLVGVCHNHWTLDRTGRQITDAQSFCGILPARASPTSN